MSSSTSGDAAPPPAGQSTARPALTRGSAPWPGSAAHAQRGPAPSPLGFPVAAGAHAHGGAGCAVGWPRGVGRCRWGGRGGLSRDLAPTQRAGGQGAVRSAPRPPGEAPPRGCVAAHSAARGVRGGRAAGAGGPVALSRHEPAPGADGGREPRGQLLLRGEPARPALHGECSAGARAPPPGPRPCAAFRGAESGCVRRGSRPLERGDGSPPVSSSAGSGAAGGGLHRRACGTPARSLPALGDGVPDLPGAAAVPSTELRAALGKGGLSSGAGLEGAQGERGARRSRERSCRSEPG